MLFSVLPTSARDKKDALQYGMGLLVNIPAPEAEVLKVVEDVVQNGMIRGTKEYAKDEFVSGATPASDSSLFAPWTEGGKVFYKVRHHAVDPRNFKDSSDVGTLAVRYVVMKQDETHTVLRIDAVFVEDFRRRAHASDGSVENAEYKDIHDHVESFQLMKDQAVEAEREKQEATEKNLETSSTPSAVSNMSQPLPEKAVQTPLVAVSATASIADLQKKARELRQLTVRKVKSTGTLLKSAPFHTASSLQTLSPGAEILIVISTPYWFGVETHDGQHGWVPRDDLEEMP
ncbi:MAG: SH3 domain-containing protein [Candidatus Sulfotelmatobacter sp.]